MPRTRLDLEPATTPTSRTPSPQPPPAEPLSPLAPISPWPPPLPSHSADESASPSTHNHSEAEPPLPLPSAKEIYGFIAVLLTYLAFALYLVWAFCPPRWLDAVGWTWDPDREWAVIIPCYLMVLVLLAYLTYAGLIVYNTPGFDSPSLITDPYANISPKEPGGEPYYHRFADRRAVPEAVDLPVDLVGRVLYPPRARRRKK